MGGWSAEQTDAITRERDRERKKARAKEKERDSQDDSQRGMISARRNPGVFGG